MTPPRRRPRPTGHERRRWHCRPSTPIPHSSRAWSDAPSGRSPACPPRSSGSSAPLGAQVVADAAATANWAPTCAAWAPRRANCGRSSAEALAAISALEVELARLEAETAQATRRLSEAGAEPLELTDLAALAERRERLLRRREQLGEVNPLAKEEYAAERERLEELSVQRVDLARSLDELEQLRAELTETVERRFEETFAAVEKHFHEVVGSLFPGGEGRPPAGEPTARAPSPASRWSFGRPGSA